MPKKGCRFMRGSAFFPSLARISGLVLLLGLVASLVFGIGCCSAMLAQWELPCPSHWIFSWPSWRTATSGDAPRLATLQIGKFNIGGSIMATRRRRLQLQTWLRKWRLFWFCLGLSLASWISLWVVIDICNNAHKLENVMHCQVKAYMVMECQKLAMA